MSRVPKARRVEGRSPGTYSMHLLGGLFASKLKIVATQHSATHGTKKPLPTPNWKTEQTVKNGYLRWRERIKNY